MGKDDGEENGGHFKMIVRASEKATEESNKEEEK